MSRQWSNHALYAAAYGLAAWALAAAATTGAGGGAALGLVVAAAAAVLVLPPLGEAALGSLCRRPSAPWAASPGRSAVVYSPRYDIRACGLERLHPFDSTKYSGVFRGLRDAGVLRDGDESVPRAPTFAELRLAHSARHLAMLHQSTYLTMVLEVPVFPLPSWLLRALVLDPMALQAGGTALAAEMALERGFAVNLGGGFHHCHRGGGGGFCPFADHQLALAALRRRRPLRVIYLDCDAHQGNGFERDALGRDDTYVVDFYNHAIYPNDRRARRAIDIDVDAGPMGDAEYLAALRLHLAAALRDFGGADLVLYNAGTDCLAGDPLGRMRLTADALVRRDAIVVELCRAAGVPVAMALSGGYQRSNAAVISASLANLDRQFAGIVGGGRAA